MSKNEMRSSGEHRSTVHDNADPGIPYAGVVSAFVAVTALVPIFGAWIGGEAFGILGMLFSVPVCAVLFSLYLEYMKNAHLLRRGLFNIQDDNLLRECRI